MKAIILTEAGGTENLQLQEMERPILNEQEVLIKVNAISINPVDIKTRKGGAFYAPLKEKGPVILGWDVSGVVVEAGSGVKDFKKGDEVFGMVNFPGHGKAYSEYVAAPASHLALKPSNVSHAEAAATTLAALTAWQVLVHQAAIQAGHHVLIHAAAGGVGHFAVQIAKHLGAKVTGTASAANETYLREWGIDNFIDYTKQNFAESAGKVDIVLDPVGGDTTERSLQILERGGILVSIVGGVKDHLKAMIDEKGITAKNYLVQSSGEDMKQLARLLEEGHLKPTVSHRFSLAEIPQAHRQIETGRIRGKVVVILD